MSEQNENTEETHSPLVRANELRRLAETNFNSAMYNMFLSLTNVGVGVGGTYISAQNLVRALTPGNQLPHDEIITGLSAGVSLYAFFLAKTNMGNGLYNLAAGWRLSGESALAKQTAIDTATTATPKVE